MAAPLIQPAASQPAPRIGFVSLGCPKALTDSELILTQLSAEGYQTTKTFAGAEVADWMAAIAGMPASTISTNSRALSPCAETPVSVPNNIFTPAL